uniref:Uncharacterized protein n=1 Tax=Janibacter limosus TaxID=53458 RepID=A0AC61U488_9MICO|nr:hypothetical protein [Janibacter limosus]
MTLSSRRSSSSSTFVSSTESRSTLIVCSAIAFGGFFRSMPAALAPLASASPVTAPDVWDDEDESAEPPSSPPPASSSRSTPRPWPPPVRWPVYGSS